MSKLTEALKALQLLDKIKDKPYPKGMRQTATANSPMVNMNVLENLEAQDKNRPPSNALPDKTQETHVSQYYGRKKFRTRKERDAFDKKVEETGNYPKKRGRKSSMSKLTKALELLKATGYSQGLLQEKRRKPSYAGAPGTMERVNYTGKLDKYQLRTASERPNVGIDVGGKRVYVDENGPHTLEAPKAHGTGINQKTGRPKAPKSHKVGTVEAKERKKPVFKVPEAPKPSDGGELTVSGLSEGGKKPESKLYGSKKPKEKKPKEKKVTNKKPKKSKGEELVDFLSTETERRANTERPDKNIKERVEAASKKAKKIKKATEGLEEVLDEVRRRQEKRERKKKKLKKSATQRLLEQLKSDVEQGVYGNVAGRPTNGLSTDTKIDAPKDYEGQSHDGIRSEQFKYEDKKPKVDDDHKNKAGEFVYSEHVPYKTKSFGAVGVPLTQENTWGMKYATKEEVEAYLSKQNVLNKVEQPEGESISFGDDYQPKPKKHREYSDQPKESKMSKEQQARIQSAQDKYARGQEYGRKQRAKEKEPGEITDQTRFIADDGSVHRTEAARNSRNVMVGQMRGTDRAPKMYGDKED